ncbi:hypothetical protein FHL15_005611 [Xylaria flabelliformis]|uniref:Peptidase S8/S53 domain-containing protein n=1 Tax=Xylaria flabelliformis TaxID=2512241 RepID=A0A553I0B2_9PEZI|nr:hypothetical protein FHL15_005611 [Xylaria flabelliformis]
MDERKKPKGNKDKGRITKHVLKEQVSNRRQNDQKEEDKLLDLLEKALKGFPKTCSDTCNPHKCEDVYDVENHEEAMKLKDELKTFEMEHLHKLTSANSVRFGRQTLLHIMVNEWSKDDWSLKQKRFLGWMLQQQNFRIMLEDQNEDGVTPMHIALSKKVDEFVNCVLEAKGLGGIINILKKDSTSTGNCLHIATKYNFPNLKAMIDKCTDNKDVLVSTNRSHRDTPLHVAVKDLILPVMIEDLPEEPPEEAPDNSPFDTDSNQGDGEYEQVTFVKADFSRDHEEDDSDYHPSQQDADADNSTDGKDSENGEPNQYRPETHEERLERLRTILATLEKETTRPRPPLPHHTHKEGRLGHVDTLLLRAGTSPEFIELPPSHNVRLLVEANPEALEMLNEAERTPYREREEALLNDPDVQKVISEYATQPVHELEEEDSDSNSMSDLECQQIVEDRKKWARRMIVVKDPVAHYIRSYCLRHSKSREDAMKRLYQPGKECHIEFDLAGMPDTVIPQAYLDQLALHLKFESILKYVALPALSIERQPLSNNTKSSQLIAPSLPRGGCSDLVAVFDWLWRNGVREIIKVMVVDDRDRPHADAAIVEALYGFKVEEWDWKRVDLCSDVIHDASPTVKEVSLYCSGNNAVLMGWASAEGLGNSKKFPQLEKVNIYVRDGLEDVDVRKRNTDRCKASIEKHREISPNHEKIQVEIIPDKNKVSFSSEFYNATDGRDPPWIESIQNFSRFLKAASDKMGDITPIKIAIIDDGIDATVVGLHTKIVGGATFCPYPHSSELVNSYFVPSGKHGTLMAQLICRLCPDVQLYIARLEELPTSTGNGRRVTARSAAKAVDWAINCGVNIISMSWTIQTTGTDNPDMKNLQTAINRANTSHILMFCSASDQGGHTPERCYPGDWNQCVRIGGATFAGDKLTWVDDKVDFWFPGRNVPFPSSDGKTVAYESGSSVATAAATGLAGVLLYAARLVYTNKTEIFQDRDELQNALKNMASGSDKKFPRCNEILGRLFKEKLWKEKKRHMPSTERGNRGLSIETLSWDRVSQPALKELVDHIQIAVGVWLHVMPDPWLATVGY